MQELQKIKQLCSLHDKFKTIENDSKAQVTVPEQHYLVVRLDGIGLSKKYLKSQLVSKLFQKTMLKAIKDTYYVLHRKTPTDAQQIFLGAIVASDEVSFILNTYSNYYDDRLFKLVTTIASTFSCFFTKEGLQQNSKHSIYGSFDGRPLILSNIDEVKEYIAYRSAIYNRNSIAKTLRLKGVPEEELYNEINHNNIDYYQEKCEQLNININGINKDCIYLSPCITDDGKLKKYNHKSFERFTELTSNSIDSFENWLHETNVT
ncbi:tRNA(His) guanylyltransferase Thg1 family protein [Aliivibrio fischeri]|uniref:tRNA(His) guanylyltransferase Thg1 family protein n=1 Tax=Aliivibrio fischeri TaxID=668 RepID=UPI0012D98C07|nr:tRNA(His) guanylyltransferase Thg1 family protein [Aliivibrio fischeri]MUI53316.1 hypothetical protein [Aliivibrio fischeri]